MIDMTITNVCYVNNTHIHLCRTAGSRWPRWASPGYMITMIMMMMTVIIAIVMMIILFV